MCYYVLLYKEELIKLLNVCYYMCVIICVHSYRFFSQLFLLFSYIQYNNYDLFNN